MELHFFLKGIILGFSMAAPVGPIGILCIRRSFQYGRWSGLFSGLGAAFADTLYGAIAAFGLTLVGDLFLAYDSWLRFFGGFFLFCLGWKTFTSRSDQRVSVNHQTLIGDFFSTLFLTLTNPMTLFSYLAIFAGLGLCDTQTDLTDGWWLILGVFLGSTCWWLLLSEGITLLRHKFTPSLMHRINWCAGGLIMGFAAVVWLTLLMPL